MNEYKKPYLILFNAITDATRKIDENDILMARHIMIRAQIDAEEAFLSAGDNTKIFLDVIHNEKP